MAWFMLRNGQIELFIKSLPMETIMNSKKLLLASILATLPSLGFAWVETTATNNEPVPILRDLSGLPWVQYGDAQSYSIPISTFYYQLVNDSKTDPYGIGPNDAKKSVFVVTNDTFRTLPGMEEPFTPPTGTDSNFTNGTTNTSFVTNPTTGADWIPPVTTFVPNAWDIEVSTLETYLTVGKEVFAPVFYFQNNQTGTAAGNNFTESLAAWARVWITDADGKTVDSFLFTNNLSPYNLVSQGGGGTYLGDVTAFSSTATAPRIMEADGDTDFVLSGGDICVAYSTTNTLLFPVPVPCGSTLTAALIAAGYTNVSTGIEHNLGENEWSYAVIFPELNALLAGLYANPTGYTMHVDVRLGCSNDAAGVATNGFDPCPTDIVGVSDFGKALNNGPESMILGGARIIPDKQIPEPGVLALLGMGLIGMAAMRRRRIG